MKNIFDQNMIPDKFVFTLDETGCQPYVDAFDIQVIVPFQHEGDEVFVPVERRRKRNTMICSISADSSLLKPAFIIPRKTYEDELTKMG